MNRYQKKRREREQQQQQVIYVYLACVYILYTTIESSDITNKVLYSYKFSLGTNPCRYTGR